MKNKLIKVLLGVLVVSCIVGVVYSNKDSFYSKFDDLIENSSTEERELILEEKMENMDYENKYNLTYMIDNVDLPDLEVVKAYENFGNSFMNLLDDSIEIRQEVYTELNKEPLYVTIMEEIEFMHLIVDYINLDFETKKLTGFEYESYANFVDYLESYTQVEDKLEINNLYDVTKETEEKIRYRYKGENILSIKEIGFPYDGTTYRKYQITTDEYNFIVTLDIHNKFDMVGKEKISVEVGL